MKRFIMVILVILVLSASAMLAAAEKRIGAGFILGSPSGITGKLFLDESNAVDIGLGVASADGFYLYGDYLRHFSGVFPAENLFLYFGIGPGYHRYEREKRGENEVENRLEARLPIGLEYVVDKAPLGLFIELAPALRVVPDIDFEVRGGIGLRYYF
jgi:hypothetical protein